MATTVGTALYAVLTIPFNVLTFPEISLLAARPAVAIPVLFGFVFGPIAGFFSGFFGNIISNQISFGTLLWNWDLGSGLIGLVPALGYYVIKRADWPRWTGLTASSVLAVIASAIGTGFAAVTDFVFQFGVPAFSIAVAEFVPAFVTAAANGAVFAPIFLYAYATSTARRARKS